MINSRSNKIEKVAWLFENNDQVCPSELKIQKFLFFYEMFCKICEKDYDLDSLKAYANGPVFGSTYGDYRLDRKEFMEKVMDTTNFSNVDENIARTTKMLIDTFTDKELSDFTHNFSLWNSKKDRIIQGEKHIIIFDEDITSEDEQLLRRTYQYFNGLAAEGLKTIEMLNKIFVFQPDDYANLTEVHYQTLELLSRQDDLENPVFIEIEDGVLLVD